MNGKHSVCSQETPRRQADDISSPSPRTSVRRLSAALALGALVLFTARLSDAPLVGAGDQTHSTLAAARTHGTPASPLVGLVAVAVGLAAIRLWRSLAATTPSVAVAHPQLPIRRRGPPSSTS